MYHRYSNSQTPVSKWGHAMFAAGDPERVEHYGKNHFCFDGSCGPHISDIIDDIKSKITDDIRNGYSEVDDSEFQSLGISEKNIEKFIAAYNPEDIVDSAGAWDNSYLVAIAWAVCDDNGIGAILLDDGAVVFDEKLIDRP